jgi:hypothetical protein
VREQIRIVEAELRTLGLPWRREPGGKHQRFVVEAGDSTITVPVAFSPRDRHHAGLNTAKQIRRAVAAARGEDP